MRYAFVFFAGAALVAGAIAACGSSGVATTSAGFGGAASTGSKGSGGLGDTGGSTATGIVLPDAGTDGATCPTATTCEKEGKDCGKISDGCNGVLECGTCTGGKVCGAGSLPNVCGGTPCIPKTCGDLGVNCGPAGDGCNKPLDCGMCTNGETCGGGGTPSVCGTGSVCVPTTCAAQAVNCGTIGDGCGNSLSCGSTCPPGQSCGGGGVPSVCGAPPCTPKTCQQLGTNCGPVGDGCGGLLLCGNCSQPKTCGGGGTPSVCGIPSSCTNLCQQQVTCANPAVTTTITGTVFAPNGADPLLNALVYVPNDTVKAFTPGVSCDKCGAPASGSPLVSATTGIDGKFTLKNVPVGAAIPVVIQLGRWRRQVTIDVTACQNNVLTPDKTHLPTKQAEGDIPLMAFSTGAIDSLECVIRKIGVVDAEFTAVGQGGRIHLYEGIKDPVTKSNTGAVAPGGSPSETTLWGTQAAINQYDMVFFPCQADQSNRTKAAQDVVVNYANAGGRVFATHFSYVWLTGQNSPDAANPFSGTAQWQVEQMPQPADQDGYINQSFPKGQALAQWLVEVNASSTLGQIPLQILRHDHNKVIAPSQSWMTIHDPVFPNATVHYTFNTPVSAAPANQCGRVLFDDFHVEDTTNIHSIGVPFPMPCVGTTMTPQEKLLEFMIFDLGSCVTPDIPTPCVPKTCGQLGVACGPTGDGCGNLIPSCGSCPGSQTCGGGGIPSQCGMPTCNALTCAQQGIHCGPAGDGCGNAIMCGSCPAGQTCGGGGQPGVCGNQPCTAKTCQQQGIACGPAGDGCGGPLTCGSCPTGQTCGGGGVPGQCGSLWCMPKTCTKAELGANCGPVADGCGNIIQCGVCAVPQTCGGGGTPSVCGGSGPH